MKIRRLKLARYRQFKDLTWDPAEGLNCLIGSSDSGKTTILDAITLALSPSPSNLAVDTDYLDRDSTKPFEIKLVLGDLSKEFRASKQPPPLWGWSAEDKELSLAPSEHHEAAVVIGVRGTSELELERFVLTPGEEEEPVPRTYRRQFQFCRVGGLGDTGREFRMGRGSQLSETLGHDGVRARVLEAVGDASSQLELPPSTVDSLDRLSKELDKVNIVNGDLALEILPPSGLSALGMLGLTSSTGTSRIPIANFGKGTQRLASFFLASQGSEGNLIYAVDEVEHGLEPYRQRRLVGRLRSSGASAHQAFVSTHSATVIDALSKGELHRVVRSTNGCSEVRLLGETVERVRVERPEAFISKFPLICEGKTEIALLRECLTSEFLGFWFDLDALGICLVDGNGQPGMLDLAEAMIEHDFRVGVWADIEAQHSGRRQRIDDHPDGYLGRFTGFRNTEDAFAKTLPVENLEEFIRVAPLDTEGFYERRVQGLATRLEHSGKTDFGELLGLVGEERMREAIGKAASNNEKAWFKSRDCSHALANWAANGGMPDQLKQDIVTMAKEIKVLIS